MVHARALRSVVTMLVLALGLSLVATVVAAAPAHAQEAEVACSGVADECAPDGSYRYGLELAADAGCTGVGTVRWGDGTVDTQAFQPGDRFFFEHQYAAPGVYTVRASAVATDPDTGEGCGTLEEVFTVEVPDGAVAEEAGPFDPGFDAGFDPGAAIREILRGNPGAGAIDRELERTFRENARRACEEAQRRLRPTSILIPDLDLPNPAKNLVRAALARAGATCGQR